MNKISEKSWVSLSLVIVIIGGVFWLSTLYARANSNSENLKDLKSYVYRSLERIDAKLDYIIDRLPKK